MQAQHSAMCKRVAAVNSLLGETESLALCQSNSLVQQPDACTVRASSILGAINWCTAAVQTVPVLRVCVLESNNARSDCGFREAQFRLQADQKSSTHAVYNCTLPTAMLWCTAAVETVPVLRVGVLEKNNAHSDYAYCRQIRSPQHMLYIIVYC
jgi:hypothetical protein